MDWDIIFKASVLFTCTTAGMVMGAWWASRGFTKALIKLREEIEEGKWDE